ncbi:hypothetical protein Tco_0409060 [Tanacetum coccineum]
MDESISVSSIIDKLPAIPGREIHTYFEHVKTSLSLSNLVKGSKDHSQTKVKQFCVWILIPVATLLMSIKIVVVLRHMIAVEDGAIPEPRKGKRVRKAKSYGSDFQLYLVEGSRDQVGSQYSYCYSIEEDPRTYNEAMQSRDSYF